MQKLLFLSFSIKKDICLDFYIKYDARILRKIQIVPKFNFVPKKSVYTIKQIPSC